MFGGQAGVQKQFGNNIVLGVEASGAGSQADGWAYCPHSTWKCQTKVDNVLELVGRIGYAWDNFLPYFKGGYALTHLESTTVPTFAAYNGDKSHAGWVIGGGLEYALSDYPSSAPITSHIDAGVTTYSPAAIPGVWRTVDASIDTVAGRLTYKFSPGSAKTYRSQQPRFAVESASTVRRPAGDCRDTRVDVRVIGADDERAYSSPPPITHPERETYRRYTLQRLAP